MEIKINFRHGGNGSLEIKTGKSVWELYDIKNFYSQKIIVDDEMDERVTTGSCYGTLFDRVMHVLNPET